MRAWKITTETGPEGLRLDPFRTGPPRGRELLIELEASALNRADLLQTLGRYPLRGENPAIPGLEFSGRVLDRGPDANRFAVGDAVMGLADGGAFAERFRVDERLVMQRPAALSASEAGAFPEAFLTAFDALVRQGELAAGDSVLVHAAGSGVGTAAVMLAREIGARVIATSSPPKHERLRKLGAAAVIDSRADDLATRLVETAGPDGVQVVLDLIGARTLDADLRAAAVGARIVVIGLLGGARAEIDLGLLMRRRASIRGSLLRPRSADEKAALIADFEAAMGPALAAGSLRPIIHETFDFDELPRAFAAMQGNENFGKIGVIRRPTGERP